MKIGKWSDAVGKRKNELMVGTLPNVADFIREMAADKQAILAKAAQKKRQLQAFMAKEGDHQTNFNAKMVYIWDIGYNTSKLSFTEFVISVVDRIEIG